MRSIIGLFALQVGAGLEPTRGCANLLFPYFYPTIERFELDARNRTSAISKHAYTNYAHFSKSFWSRATTTLHLLLTVHIV